MALSWRLGAGGGRVSGVGPLSGYVDATHIIRMPLTSLTSVGSLGGAKAPWDASSVGLPERLRG